MKFLYQRLDEDNDGSLTPDEIVNGLRDRFNVYFSDLEAAKLIMYIDADKSGDIDFEEFSSKINYNNYNKNYSRFLITKARFIDIVIDQWEIEKQKLNQRLMEIFVKFDDNGDGVLTFEEFEVLVNNLEPNLQKSKISSLFNEVSFTIKRFVFNDDVTLDS